MMAPLYVFGLCCPVLFVTPYTCLGLSLELLGPFVFYTHPPSFDFRFPISTFAPIRFSQTHPLFPYSQICLKITINPSTGSATFDFTHTGPEVRGNLNAPISVVHSAVIYCLRAMLDEEIPLNAGCLVPITSEFSLGILFLSSRLRLWAWDWCLIALRGDHRDIGHAVTTHPLTSSYSVRSQSTISC
jgi:hypothetical protein